MKKKYIIILTILALLLCIGISKTNWTSLTRGPQCWEKLNMMNQGFNGPVTQKFNDPDNHNYNTILILDRNKKVTTKLFFINEKSGFYNLVNVGDTLKKTYDSLVITNISSKETFNLKYDCIE